MQLNVIEVITLVVGILFFVGFFVAMYAQVKVTLCSVIKALREKARRANLSFAIMNITLQLGDLP